MGACAQRHARAGSRRASASGVGPDLPSATFCVLQLAPRAAAAPASGAPDRQQELCPGPRQPQILLWVRSHTSAVLPDCPRGSRAVRRGSSHCTMLDHRLSGCCACMGSDLRCCACRLGSPRSAFSAEDFPPRSPGLRSHSLDPSYSRELQSAGRQPGEAAFDLLTPIRGYILSPGASPRKPL